MQAKVDNNGGSKMGASKWEQAMMGKSKWEQVSRWEKATMVKASESKHVGARNDDGSKWEYTCWRRHARVGDDGESKQKQIKMELWWWRV
jgi:hypothetical protein